MKVSGPSSFKAIWSIKSPTQEPPGGGGTDQPKEPVILLRQLEVSGTGELVIEADGRTVKAICLTAEPAVITAARIEEILIGENVKGDATVTIRSVPSD